jgi:hypothetical protein
MVEAFNEALPTEFFSGDDLSQSVALLNSLSTNTLGDSPDLPWGSLYNETITPEYDLCSPGVAHKRATDPLQAGRERQVVHWGLIWRHYSRLWSRCRPSWTSDRMNRGTHTGPFR